MSKRLSLFEQVKAFLIPLLKNRLFKNLFGSTAPEWYFHNVTRLCDKKCGYCYATLVQAKLQITSEGKDIIDSMHAKGCRIVAFMGGEPLLLKESLAQMIAHATSKRMFTYVTTNLAALDKELLQSLINSGLCFVDIAIDVMDKTNRKGFDKSLAGITEQFRLVLKARQKYGLHIKFNVVITRLNIKDVKTLIEYAHKMKIPCSLHLVDDDVSPEHRDNFPWLEPEMLFKAEDYKKIEGLVNWIISKKKQGYWILNSFQFFELIKEKVKYGIHSGWDCQAGKLAIFVDHKGDLFPCGALQWDKPKWGNIKTATLPLDSKEMAKQLTKCNKSCLACANTLTWNFGQGLSSLSFVMKYVKAYIVDYKKA